MIKVIIFDFDSTIYVGDIGDEDKVNDRTLVEKCFGKGVYDYFVTRYQVDKKDIKDIIEICRKEGRDYKRLAQLFSDNIFIHTIKDRIELLPNSFFQKLSNKYHLYVVSMSQKKYLDYYFDLYDIDKSCFEDIMCLDLIHHASKADIFKLISKNEKCNLQEMLMIGDSYAHDIEPALNLGMKVFYFKGDFTELYDFLTDNNICDCEEFKEKRKFISK